LPLTLSIGVAGPGIMLTHAAQSRDEVIGHVSCGPGG
jgi:hypothetical protein